LVEWVNVFSEPRAYGRVSADDTGAFSNGWIDVGGFDYGLLLKHSPEGDVLWSRQFGSAERHTQSYDVSADGMGNAYIVGRYYPQCCASSPTSYIKKYDGDGNLLWERELPPTRDGFFNAVAANEFGNVYAAGEALGSGPGVVLASFDPLGNQLWMRQFGTDQNENVSAVATDANGNAYVVGNTTGDFGGANQGFFDAFVTKYDAAGEHLWTRQFGGWSREEASDVAVDEFGNVYVTGYTEGGIGTPEFTYPFDAVLAKYDAEGGLQWIRQYNLPVIYRFQSVDIDSSGDLFVAGKVSNSQSQPGMTISKIDEGGDVLWTLTALINGREDITSLSVDDFDNVYAVGGLTEGREFILKLNAQVPESSSIATAALGIAILGVRRAANQARP
jgi:hypothetical protein